MTSEIGQTGKLVNLTTATRAINIAPDLAQIKQFDESAEKTTKFRTKLIIAFVFFAGLTTYLYMTGHWIIASFLVLILLLLLFFITQINNTTVYESGLIVPAIIINTNPIQLLFLADMRTKEEGQKLVYGCQKITIKNLPHHKLELNEKVPCVSMFGLASEGYRRHFEPRPIAWGYQNKNYIPEVVDFITHSTEEGELLNEWEVLERLKETMQDYDKENDVVFFDADLNQIDLEKMIEENNNVDNSNENNDDENSKDNNSPDKDALTEKENG